MYIIRLDDASSHMHHENWNKMEKLLDNYNIKPIVGIIPNNKDKELLKYPYDKQFWDKTIKWEKKGWIIALHGFEHVYSKECGGINPVQRRSEFAGHDLKTQKEKIKEGFNILVNKGLSPTVFFAPSHTFDENTLKAIREETNIKIISDTISNDIYYREGLYFIPQQSGYVRKLPLKIVTFCYHPNTMMEDDYYKLENFIKKNRKKFLNFANLKFKKRELNFFDLFLRKIYFLKRR